MNKLKGGRKIILLVGAGFFIGVLVLGFLNDRHCSSYKKWI